MPKVKIDHIISFSSEDAVHLANNILSSDTSKKWKCQTSGEKNAVVVLQLEKASVISGIDIGNEHSAYVEILVSRSGTNEDYKVLLVTSSFMTPLESRQSQNVNKVRMFNKEHFSKPECDEKWDRIKVVCSQPFNKHVQYGLSFINVHTTDDKIAVQKQTHIGKFVLRPESPDDLSVGSLFEKQKHQKQEEKLTGAAAIREASSLASLALYGSPVCKPKLKTQSSPSTSSSKKQSDSCEEAPKHRNRNELLYSKDEEEPNDKIDKIMERKLKEKETKAEDLKLERESKAKEKMKHDEAKTSNKKEKNGTHRQSPKPPSTIHTPSSSKDKVRNENNRKRKTNEKTERNAEKKRIKKEATTKPFAQLLEGVTLVISGIQNPDRGNLRAHALSMGAKYKPDWDSTCTHLICAFPNTPKFNQVRGKGKIVKKKWLEDCHSQRKRLPWRRYALDKNDVGKNESEDEICEKIQSPPRILPSSPQTISVSDSDYDAQNDAGSDTEERIARIQEFQKINEKEIKKQNDIYSADTDEESPIRKTSLEPPKKLENIFDDKKFYIDESFDLEVYNKVLKYIAAYNGNLIVDPTEDIDIIITSKGNSNSFKEVNPSALCLGPEWIWNCHNSQKLVPIDEHVY